MEIFEGVAISLQGSLPEKMNRIYVLQITKPNFTIRHNKDHRVLGKGIFEVIC